MYEVADAISRALGLGLDSHELTALHMGLRAIVVYVIVLAIVRLGHKRFLGRSTAFDFIVAILLGSIASRAITGNAPFFPVLAASAVLVFVHWVFAWGAFRSHRFGLLVKGKPIVLIENGRPLADAMRKASISEHDLIEALRVQGDGDDPARIKIAHLERSGDISASAQPRVVEVEVARGVQTVRIELA